MKGFTVSFFQFLFLFVLKHLIDYCIFINACLFLYLAQMLFDWNLTVENITFSSILIRWTNLTNVLNRKVRHYVVFLNRRINTVTLHQVVNGDQLTTEINGLTYSTNYSVEVVGVDTMGKPYKTPSEATMTANRKRETPLFFCFCFCLFVFCSVKRSVQFRKSREIFLVIFRTWENVWKIELKSWFFFKATTTASQVNFFRVVQIFFNLACTLWKKLCSFVPAFFFFPQVSIDHLFDNLERGKKIHCFGKKTEKSLEFWIKNLHK